MAVLDKAAILAANDRPYEEHHVDEWGGVVRIGVMSGADRLFYEDEVAAQTDKKVPLDVRALILALSIVDENNLRVFGVEDIPAIAAKNSRVLDKLARIAMRVNGLRRADVEEAAKN